jgi:ABC-2 type transport system permease protein
MKAWAIAATAVRRLMRDKSNIFFVFILPMMLVLLLGAMFGGGNEDRLGIISEGSGAYGEDLVALLEGYEEISIHEEYEDRGSLIRALERGQLEAALIIPDDFDESLDAGEKVTIEFVARSDASAQGMRNTVDSAVKQQGQIFRAATFAHEAGAADSFSGAFEMAEEVAADAAEITIEEEAVGEEFALDRIGTFDLGAYSQLLLFIFLTSTTGSAALIQSRQLGVSRRMASTPTPMGTILVGEGLGRLAVALVQGVFIMGGTALVFGVDWGDPLGAAAILIAFSLGAAGTGMLMGATFKNDQQAGGIGVMIGLGLAALGGCMMPLYVMEIFSPTLYQVAHITPHAWGIEAFDTLILEGGAFSDILLELGVLLAFAAVVFALATWRLRAVLTR